MYILDKPLADGTSIPRWKPRSQPMSYMGILPGHAMNSPLALNPDTAGFIRQQSGMLCLITSLPQSALQANQILTALNGLLCLVTVFSYPPLMMKTLTNSLSHLQLVY